MALKHLVDLDLGGNEIQNVVLQNLATAPTGVEGQIFYDTASNAVKVHTGSGFVRIGSSADGSTITESNGTFSVGTIAISNVSGLQTSLNSKVDDSQVLTNVPANAVFTDSQRTDEDIRGIVSTQVVAGANVTLDKTDPEVIVVSSTDTTYTIGDGGLTQKNFTTTLKTKLDGIEAGATNTADPAISTNGSVPALATGITAAEVRSLIGAGTSSFNGAYGSLTGIPSTFTPSAHVHDIDDITGLISALDDKAPLASPALTGTPTAPTAAGGNNTTQIATTAFVTSEISRVVDAAPAALDTLNELAASLNDDDDFAGTMTTALAGKLATTHDMTLTLSGDASGAATFTNMGNATLSVTVADDSHNHTIANVDGLQTALNAKLNSSAYTAADVLAKVKTVDGAGSGLDADLLDGQSSAYYRNYNNLTNKPTIPQFVSQVITGTGAATDLGIGLAGFANIQIYENGNLIMTDIFQDGAGAATANIPNGLEVQVVAVGL